MSLLPTSPPSSTVAEAEGPGLKIANTQKTFFFQVALEVREFRRPSTELFGVSAILNRIPKRASA
jgi:hypothetical protein